MLVEPSAADWGRPAEGWEAHISEARLEHSAGR